MKNSCAKLIVFLFALFTCSIPVFSYPVPEPEKQNDIPDFCRHSSVFEFDNDTMMLINACNTNTVEWLTEDVAFWGDRAIVLDGNQIITDGYLKEGMAVQIYHGDRLYGEYTIAELHEPLFFLLNGTNSIQANNTNAVNAYGWILPKSPGRMQASISASASDSKQKTRYTLYRVFCKL